MREEACVCDRCKKLYEVEDNTIIVVTTANNVDIIRADICEDCRNLIYDFFEGKPAEEKEKRGRGRKRRIDDETREKIIKLKKSGLAMREVAESTGVNISTCNRIYRESHPEVKKVDIDRGRVEALHRAGRTVEWIADDIGASVEDVDEIIKAFQLPSESIQ